MELPFKCMQPACVHPHTGRACSTFARKLSPTEVQADVAAAAFRVVFSFWDDNRHAWDIETTTEQANALTELARAVGFSR
jgi:hypothetical protein